MLVITSSILIYTLTYIVIIKKSYLMEFNPEKYKNNKLPGQTIHLVKESLEKYIQNEKNFRSKKINLNKISDDLGFPPHVVSQVVNSAFEMNINDYINKSRIHAVTRKLLDPEYKHYKILAIAFEKGYSTMASFYNAFKRHVGCTPTLFIERNASSKIK